MASDEERALLAERILYHRRRRLKIFPSNIFDECAWEMLLGQFVMQTRFGSVEESKLFAYLGVDTKDGGRWLYLLAKDGQIKPRVGGDQIGLTEGGLSRLRDFLDLIS